MSEINRHRLIIEIEVKLERSLASAEIPEERKIEVQRQLLAIAVMEQ